MTSSRRYIRTLSSLRRVFRGFLPQPVAVWIRGAYPFIPSSVVTIDFSLTSMSSLTSLIQYTHHTSSGIHSAVEHAFQQGHQIILFALSIEDGEDTAKGTRSTELGVEKDTSDMIDAQSWSMICLASTNIWDVLLVAAPLLVSLPSLLIFLSVKDMSCYGCPCQSIRPLAEAVFVDVCMTRDMTRLCLSAAMAWYG